MSIFRAVPTGIWNDDTFLSMSPEQKLQYLYLHTAPNATQCGIYKISFKVASFHLGFTHAPFESALRGLCAAFPELVMYDEETGEIALLNYPRQLLTNASPRIWKQVTGELRNVKSIQLLKEVIKRNSATAGAVYLQRLRQLQTEGINQRKNKKHGEVYNTPENQGVKEEKEIEKEIEKESNTVSPRSATGKVGKAGGEEKKPHLIKDLCTDFDRFIGGDGIDWKTDKKEVVAISKLINRLRERLNKQGEIATDERIRENFWLFLEMCRDLNDNWLNNHFTPAILNSQFNNLIIRFRNGNANKASRAAGSVVTENAVREAFSILFADGNA